MTRTEVDVTVARLKVWVHKALGCAGCDDALDDLEDLRQHDEAQAAEMERLRAALVAHAEYHEREGEADEYRTRRPAHREHARVLRAAAEGKP